MASVIVILYLSLLFTFLSSSSLSVQEEQDIHEILPKYSLPKGVFPNTANSYSLSSSDGSFVVRLESPCYVRFDDQLVYYDKLIKGRISSGSVSGVSGIQAKKLFLWVPVTGMDMDPVTNSIQFHVGALSEKLSADLFQTAPDCLKKMNQWTSH